MSKSNVERTLDWLRERGADVDFTERKIPYTKIKKDLYGIIDLVALIKDDSVLEDSWWLWGVQVCGGGDFAAHHKKILASDKAYKWVHGGHRKLLLIGWRKLKRGWLPRVQLYTRGDWCEMPPPPTSKIPKPDISLL